MPKIVNYSEEQFNQLLNVFSKKELDILGIGYEFRNNGYIRPTWDEYFLAIAKIIATRSHDCQTQHACILVRDNRIISTGVNGFPSNSPDGVLPNKRPQKYDYILHAEHNAILNCAKEGVSVKNSIAYLTGLCCDECSKIMVSCGILDWRIGNLGHVASVEATLRAKFWREWFGVKVTQIE